MGNGEWHKNLDKSKKEIISIFVDERGISNSEKNTCLLFNDNL
jgi:hypothetical protein